jgi:hypothetical protein
MDWRQVQFALCVAAMVMINLSGNTLLFSIAISVALINFISIRLLCIFSQICNLGPEATRMDLAFILIYVNRITGIIGVGLFFYAVLGMV